MINFDTMLIVFVALGYRLFLYLMKLYLQRNYNRNLILLVFSTTIILCAAILVFFKGDLIEFTTINMVILAFCFFYFPFVVTKISDKL